MTCEHKNRFPIPDSLASCCEECGKIFILGDPDDTDHGTLADWARDLYEAKRLSADVFEEQSNRLREPQPEQETNDE